MAGPKDDETGKGRRTSEEDIIKSALDIMMQPMQRMGFLLLAVLTGNMTAVSLLALLFGLNLLATCLTLGPGGSGGIFSPALFLGATAGGAYG